MMPCLNVMVVSVTLIYSAGVEMDREAVVAVHRHANNDIDDKTPIKRPLGPLLITIDDLQAICDFLIERLRSKSTVELSFLLGGKSDSRVLGSMDSPEDLQLLTREEMQYVRVQCDDIRIDIFKRRAYCYAPRRDQDAIFNAWIQHRRRYSWQATIMDNVPDLSIILGLASACLYWFWGPNLFGLPTVYSIISNIFVGIGALLVVAVAAALLCFVLVVKARPTIVPVRLPDWNKRRQELWQHYRTISIALLSVSIAGATFVIGHIGNK